MFELKKYFDYIELNDFCVEPTLEHLALIIKQHLNKFNYQNAVLFYEGKKPIQERKVPSLDIESLFQQFVLGKNPGYCFQNLELLAHVLTQSGFSVTKHLAHGVNKLSNKVNQKEVDEAIFNHEVLIVCLDDQSYIVDPGFANNSLRAPLVLQEGEQWVKGDLYKLTCLNNDWCLELNTPQGLLLLYQFKVNEAAQEEINEANKQLFLSSKSIPIRDGLLKFSRVTDKKRTYAVWQNGIGFYKSFSNQQVKDKPVTTIEEMANRVRKKYGIEMSPELQLILQEQKSPLASP